MNLKKSPNGAWWGPILEKGAAKFYGRYENMNGGLPSESLYALTGMPTVEFDTKTTSESLIWEYLSAADKRKYVMTASVSRQDKTDLKGLVNNHAYTLIGVAEYNKIKLVKIRNPWGAEEYKGPWSDKSSEWTTDARTALGSVVKDDGIFWIPLTSFKSLFSLFTIALYQDWLQAKKEVAWTRSSDLPSITITNTKKQRAVVGLTGNSNRMFRDSSCSTPKMIDDLLFFLENSNSGSAVDSNVSNMTTSFGPGTYYS
jgi:hypothetical protein